MTFNLQGWARASVSTNEPVTTQLDSNNVIIAANGCFRDYNYFSATYTAGNVTGDTQTQISADGYFNAVAYDLQLHDVINCFSGFELTYQKYYVVQVFDPATGQADVIIAPLGQTRETLAITSANILAMNGAPVAIVDAPGAFEAIQVLAWSVNMRPVVGPIAYTGGTNIVLQYDNTAAGAGVQAAEPIPGTAITGGTASRTGLGRGPAAFGGLTANIVNRPLFISNTGTAFAAGNGNATITILYEIIQVI